MRKIEVFMKRDGSKIAENIVVADSLLERVIGLMFKKELVGMKGLLISPCNSIHTFFMRFNIDVLFLDKNWKVIEIYKGLKPWRMTTIHWRSRYVLELPEGGLSENVKIGDELEEKCIN